MIRALLGAALPVLGFGLAAAFVGPSLVGTPGGEPMRVAQPLPASLHEASFGAAACAETLLLAERGADTLHGARIFALALQAEAGGLRVAAEEVPSGAVVPDETLLLVIDRTGRVLASGSAADLAREGSLEFAWNECGPAPEAAPAGSI